MKARKKKKWETKSKKHKQWIIWQTETLSIIIFNINSLHILIKRQSLEEWIFKIWPNYFFGSVRLQETHSLQETHLKYNDISRLKVKILEKYTMQTLT